MINIQLVIFWVFASLTLVSASMVIFQNNPVRAVLFLVVSFLSTAVLWLLLQAEFLALILALVYVGAVMTLFLFVVMMLHIEREVLQSHPWRALPGVVLVVAVLSALLLKVLPSHVPGVGLPEVTASFSNTAALGQLLYTDYVVSFELAAVLLLVAMISAVTLVHRRTIKTKRQHVVHQILRQREDSVTLVSLDSPQS